MSLRCRCQAKLSRLFLGLALATWLRFHVPARAMSEPPSPAGLLVLGLNPGLQTILRLRDLDLGQEGDAGDDAGDDAGYGDDDDDDF